MKGRKPMLTPDRDPLTKVPPAPTWLSPAAKAEWRRIMPRLVADRIITLADLAGVENYVVAIGRVREIEAMIQAADGVIDPALFRAQDKAMQTARQLAAEYGLSPVSRKRIEASETPDDDDNPLNIR
jgi:P27 family predicted phage terminase small subunit